MLTANPFNAKVEAFLNRIENRPAKFPELNEADLKRFLEIVDLAYGFDIDLTTGTIIKRKSVLDLKNDLFLWHDMFSGFYELRALRGCMELWREGKVVAIKAT